MRRTVAIAFGALLLSACVDTGAAQNNQQQPPQPLTPGLTMATSPSELDRAPTKTFDFDRIRNLWIRVALPSAQPTTTVHLSLINPQGTNYFEMLQIFATDPSMNQMPMGNEMVNVQRARAVPGGFTLDTEIPVAGSVLTRYPMLNEGVWTVNAEVGGLGSPLSTSFQVAPTPAN